MLGISILFERKNQLWYLLSKALEIFLLIAMVVSLPKAPINNTYIGGINDGI